MTTLFTTVDEKHRVIVLTMLNYQTDVHYRFLYESNSWELIVHKSGKRALLKINNIVLGVDDEQVTRPSAKLIHDGDRWNSFVSFQRKDKVFQTEQHNCSADGMLQCAAQTLRRIYHGD